MARHVSRMREKQFKKTTQFNYKQIIFQTNNISNINTFNLQFFLNRRRIKMALYAIFSSRFMTDNHLTRHAPEGRPF